MEAFALLCFSIGRLLSGFACVKMNNKYLLVGTTVTEIILLGASYFFARTMGVIGLTVSMSAIGFVRSFHWTLAMNILSRWVPHNEFTTAFALIAVTREFMSFSFFYFEREVSYHATRVILLTVLSLYVVWTFLFLVFGADGPETSFLISKTEYHYLARTIGPRKKARCNAKIPWKPIAKTIILYGWLIGDFGRESAVKTTSDGFLVALDNGIDSSVAGTQIALIFVYIAIFVAAVLTDKFLITKELLTAGQVRKIYSSIGSCGLSISMILTAYTVIPSTRLTFLTVGLIFSCIASFGLPVALFDLSPNYAAPLFAILTFLRLIITAVRITVDTHLGIYPIINETSMTSNFYRYGFLIFMTNLIFLLCGDIEKKPFDSYDTYDWTKESIISYP